MHPRKLRPRRIGVEAVSETPKASRTFLPPPSGAVEVRVGDGGRVWGGSGRLERYLALRMALSMSDKLATHLTHLQEGLGPYRKLPRGLGITWW